MCSYYANKFQGKRTASGEPYNKNAFTAAHNSLPFQTWVIVTNLNNNKSVKVRINDRGPHTKARVIDISQVAAQKIGLIQSGITKVRIEICVPDSLQDNLQPSILKDSIIYTNSTTETSETSSISENEYKIGSFYINGGKRIQPKGYYIQVSSYSNFDTFRTNEAEWTKNQKKEVYCEVAQSKSSKKLYRLMIGTFATKSEAEKELALLNKKGIKGLIKKY
jgi:rare lipoprotein A